MHFLRSVGTMITISMLAAGCSGGSSVSGPLSSVSSSSGNGLPWPQGAETLTQSLVPSGETVSLPAGIGSLSNGATTLGTITFPQSNIPIGAEVVLLAVCCPGPPMVGPSPPPPSSQAAHRLDSPTIDGTYWQMHFTSANGPLSGNVTFNGDIVLSYPTNTAAPGLVLAIIDVGTVCASASTCRNATPGPPPSMVDVCPSSVAAAATDFSCVELSLDLSQTYELAIETH